MITFTKGLALLLAALSIYCILANIILLWRSHRAKPEERIPSSIPLIGGLMGFGAVKLWRPELSWAGYAWVALVLDPGCLWYLAKAAAFQFKKDENKSA